jgi:hypothetical protein
MAWMMHYFTMQFMQLSIMKVQPWLIFRLATIELSISSASTFGMPQGTWEWLCHFLLSFSAAIFCEEPTSNRHRKDIYILSYIQKSAKRIFFYPFLEQDILRIKYPNFRNFKISSPYPILYPFFNVQCPGRDFGFQRQNLPFPCCTTDRSGF